MRHGALPQLRTVAHICHVADQHRHTGTAGLYDRVAEVIECGGRTESAQDVLLVAMLEIPARRHGVV